MWCSSSNPCTVQFWMKGVSAAAEEVMFLAASIGRLVCQDDNTKTAERISTKLGLRLGLGPE